LGDLRSKTAMHVSTEVDNLGGAVYARNPIILIFQKFSFLLVDDMKRTFNRRSNGIYRRNGSIQNRLPVRAHLSGRVGAALDPCAAIQVPFDLDAGAQREIVFTLGVGQGIEDARNLIKRYGGSAGHRMPWKL